MSTAAPAGTARRRAPTIAVLVTALLPAPALLALHFGDGPPARVTGGFGEDSCVACHSGNTLNDTAGNLTLTGFPERYTPGTTYDLELTLSRQPAIKAAGFQLAIRLADSTQAGVIQVPAEDAARVGLLEERGLLFAHHLLAKTTSTATARVLWKLSWTAPEAEAEVIVNAAAVAGNGDESQFDDHVYTLEATAERSGAD